MIILKNVQAICRSLFGFGYWSLLLVSFLWCHVCLFFVICEALCWHLASEGESTSSSLYRLSLAHKDLFVLGPWADATASGISVEQG